MQRNGGVHNGKVTIRCNHSEFVVKASCSTDRRSRPMEGIEGLEVRCSPAFIDNHGGRTHQTRFAVFQRGGIQSRCARSTASDLGGMIPPACFVRRGERARTRIARRWLIAAGVRQRRQDGTVGAPLTEAAIRKLRDMITSGRYPSGAKLPPEAELAAELGLSRNTTREAVRALSSARVLDVRRGDGTYVTSLRPEVLLEGIAFAVDLMQEDSALELIEVRRILEPAATALAAVNIDDAALASLEKSLARMAESTSQTDLVREDTNFHAQVGAASGNDTLASMLQGISSRTIRARIWRGMIDSDATARTISEHARILEALQARDRELAWATAFAHVCTTEAFMRRILADRTESPSRSRGGRRKASS